MCRQVYDHAKCELKGAFEDYGLYWPDRKACLHYDSCKLHWIVVFLMHSIVKPSVVSFHLPTQCSCGFVMIDNWD